MHRNDLSNYNWNRASLDLFSALSFKKKSSLSGHPEFHTSRQALFFCPYHSKSGSIMFFLRKNMYHWWGCVITRSIYVELSAWVFFFVKIEIVPVEFHSSLHTLQVWIYHCSSAPYYVLDGIIFPQVFFWKGGNEPPASASINACSHIIKNKRKVCVVHKSLNLSTKIKQINCPSGSTDNRLWCLYT